MKTEPCPLLDHGLQKSVNLMNLGFSDYFIHIELTLPMFLNMVRVDRIDPESSRVIYVDDEVVGVALIARRGWTSRLAAMCLAPVARGRGAGRVACAVQLSEYSLAYRPGLYGTLKSRSRAGSDPFADRSA